MIYVTKWRVYNAGRSLNGIALGIAQIDKDVGYESMASFSQAFKRYMGLSPGAWRSAKQ